MSNSTNGYRVCKNAIREQIYYKNVCRTVCNSPKLGHNMTAR